MNRRSNDQHGFIKWPRDDERYEDTGEGGLAVYAVWHRAENEVCMSGAQAWVTGDVVFWHEDDVEAIETEGLPKELWSHQTHHRISFDKEQIMDKFYMDTVPFSGFFYLGSTGKSLAGLDAERKYDGTYFQATLDDVTLWGRLVLWVLSKHYGDEPELLTFLDT